jgi:hypothetical protein
MQKGSVIRGAARAIRGGVVAIALLAAATPASAQATLTGVTIYCTGNTGSFCQSTYWNTTTGDFAFDAFVSNSLGGSFINSAGTLSVPLSVGTNTFYVYAEPGAPLPFFGVNLFADGSTTPLLSGFAPANGTGTVSTNAGLNTFGITPVTTAGVPGVIPGGPLTATIDGFQYTLTYFTFDTSKGFGDLVGPVSVGANGQSDYVGQFVITVAPVSVAVTPEPGTVALTASGLLGIFGITLRRRRAAIA